MRIAVVKFPGSNCDDDAFHVVARAIGQAASFVWHKEPSLGDAEAVILPGGLSYGDDLHAGASAANSPVMGAVKEFAERGGPVLAICHGFQIACETGLLDGTLTRNASPHFAGSEVHLCVEGKPTPWTRAIPAGRILRMPITHGEGRFVHPDIDKLEKEGRIVFRYVDHSGGETAVANPNGSMANVAGICNARGNVVGLVPHPERANESSLGGVDGHLLFASLLAEAGRRV
jgi:phosphoribosylformylglycinamidine synthase